MKKIMFNDKYGLTQAVLEGRKTMTRRTVPDKTMKDALAYQSHHIDEEKAGEKYILDHSLYKVGEIVAIAQAYKDIYPNADFKMAGDEFMTESSGWNNKMFVRAYLMPSHIKITDIKVERLQDIREEDCMREGICECKSPYYMMPCYILPNTQGFGYLYNTPREAFAALIDKVSGKGTWKKNPWVFAYSFERVD